MTGDAALEASGASILFLVILAIVIIVIVILVTAFKFSAVSDPQPITVTTPQEDQPLHVFITCLDKQQLGDRLLYKYKIVVEDLGLYSQQKYEDLLPVFIFKGSAVAADISEGIDIGADKKSPQDSIYSFKSVEANSVRTFSPIERLIITFISTGSPGVPSATECKSLASPTLSPSSTSFESLRNLEKFTKACGDLKQGTVFVTALNKCIADLVAEINLVKDPEKISKPSGENTRVTFTVSSITGITADKKVKLYVACNTIEAKNKYIPSGDFYIQQKALQTNTYQVDIECDGQGEIKLVKGCTDIAAPDGCDTPITADKEIATVQFPQPQA